MLPPKLNDSPRGTYPVCISDAEARWWRTLQDDALLLTVQAEQRLAELRLALRCCVNILNFLLPRLRRCMRWLLRG